MTAALLGALLVTNGCDTIDDRPASFSFIHTTVIRPSCATSNCHSDLASTAGLRFDTVEGAYLGLTGRVCKSSEPPGEPVSAIVYPGQPESSKLMHMLHGTEVRRMPPDTPLPPAHIDLIERWILEGAECN